MTVRLKNILTIAFTISFVLLNAQIKGKAKHLEGTWRYDGGSGFEVWEKKGEEFIGYGFRLTKFGDTIKVEDLRLALVNNNLVYSITTHQHTNSGLKIINYRFIGNKRKLEFFNIENDEPSIVRYAFGFFSKKKLKIIITFSGEDNPTKLKLTKETD